MTGLGLRLSIEGFSSDLASLVSSSAADERRFLKGRRDSDSSLRFNPDSSPTRISAVIVAELGEI